MLSALTALGFGAAALLLVLAGGLKVVDPSGTVGALRAFGIETDAPRMRVLAVAELGVGALALTVANAVVAFAVAVSYAGFTAFVVAALARDLPIDSCGCLGRLETPPGIRHLVVTGLAGLSALGQAVDPSPVLLERLADDGGAGVLFALGVLVLTGTGAALFRAGRRPSTLR